MICLCFITEKRHPPTKCSSCRGADEARAVMAEKLATPQPTVVTCWSCRGAGFQWGCGMAQACVTCSGVGKVTP